MHATEDLRKSRVIWWCTCRRLHAGERRRRWRSDAERDVTGSAGYDSAAERAPRSGHHRNYVSSDARHVDYCRRRLSQTPAMWVQQLNVLHVFIFFPVAYISFCPPSISPYWQSVEQICVHFHGCLPSASDLSLWSNFVAASSFFYLLG